MHLIRKEARVTTDERGNKTREHWDGRKDVKVMAPQVSVRTAVKEGE